MSGDAEYTLNPPLAIGDRFQVGLHLASGEIMWGTIQTVIALSSDGTPFYRPKWSKVDKVPDFWRLPKEDTHAKAHRTQPQRPQD